MNKEMVNGPAHYGGVDNPYEVIKVCEAWELDKDAYLFNVVKYVARAGKKDPQKELEDLKKAKFYLERKIGLLQKQFGNFENFSYIYIVKVEKVIFRYVGSSYLNLKT